LLEEIGVLLGGIRNYARSNFIKISSGTWRTRELNKRKLSGSESLPIG